MNGHVTNSKQLLLSDNSHCGRQTYLVVNIVVTVPFSCQYGGQIYMRN